MNFTVKLLKPVPEFSQYGFSLFTVASLLPNSPRNKSISIDKPKGFRLQEQDNHAYIYYRSNTDYKLYYNSLGFCVSHQSP